MAQVELGTFVRPEKATKLVSKKQAQIIDVRDPVSFRDGTITGAINVPLRNISSLLKMDKKTHLIFYGDKETQKSAVNYAIQMGFTNVYRLSETK